VVLVGATVVSGVVVGLGVVCSVVECVGIAELLKVAVGVT
jgi:hypothetical protein